MISQKNYCHRHDPINNYGHFVSQNTLNILRCHSKHFRYSFMTYRRILEMSNTMGASSGARTAYPVWIVLWQWFVIFLWSLYCLSVFELVSQYRLVSSYFYLICINTNNSFKNYAIHIILYWLAFLFKFLFFCHFIMNIFACRQIKYCFNYHTVGTVPNVLLKSDLIS